MPARRLRAVAGRFTPVRPAVLLLLSGLVLVITPARPTFAQASTAGRATPAGPYDAHIAEAARRFAIPDAWIRAVLVAESNGDPRAVSPKGAMGLMQIMPPTWGELRAVHRLGGDPFDPRDNIIAGAGYIRLLFDRYGSPGWIAAYNAGPGRYEASLAGRPLPAETRAYVAAVAPAIGEGGVEDGRENVAVDPLAWTHAPLFIAQRGRTPAADGAPAERAAGERPAAIDGRDGPDAAVRSHGLFVARVSEGAPR